MSLYHQKLRWAQRWLQVTLKYTPKIFISNKSLYEKFIMFLLLPYREFHHYLTLNILTSFTNYYLQTGLFNTELMKFNIILLVYKGLKILILILGGYLSKAPITVKQIILYLLLVLPYEFFKHIITLEAHFRNIRGIITWKVTSRC